MLGDRGQVVGGSVGLVPHYVTENVNIGVGEHATKVEV